MSSQTEPSPPSPPVRTNPDDATEPLPGIFQDNYNTVYERIMSRTRGDNPVPVVVACVAYSLYKEEKRQWIVQRREQYGRRPGQEEIDGYVSGCTDLRINSLITQARDIIGSFARDVLESSKEDIQDEIYRRQFEGLHDLMRGRSETGRANHEALKSHINNRTKPSWGISIAQNLLANFIWTFAVVVLLVSINLGFDFNNFTNRVKAFYSPPPEISPKQ